MSAAEFVTLTCPHCSQRLRAKAADAGRQVRCPHPNCRRAVPVPLPLEAENEPDEPVLLPEDPAQPEPVPVASAAARRRPRAVPVAAPRPDPHEPRSPQQPSNPRAPVLPWALTAGACLLAAVAVAGWVRTAVRADAGRAGAENLAALETRYRDARAENKQLRDELTALRAEPKVPSAPAPVEPRAGSTEPLPAPAPVRPPAPEPAPPRDDPPPFRPRPPRPAFPRPPEAFPRPPVVPAPVPAPAPMAPKPVGRESFVGTWTFESPEIKKQGVEIDLTIEFRDNGTCRVEAKVAGNVQELTGTWRWDGRRLHLEMDNAPGASKPADVTWNGPDEFVGTADNTPATFRRKK